MAVRKVVTRSGRGLRGYFPSRKLGRMVAWESPLERDAILQFEFSPEIISYEEQPELILYPDGGRLRRYFPDFAITGESGSQIHIEVKAAERLAQPKLAQKYRAIATYYQSQGRAYRILTELEIRCEPQFTNLQTLFRYYRHGSELDSVRRHCHHLLRHGPLPISSLGLDEETVWRLLAYRHLCCDLATPITSSTLISLPTGGSYEALHA